MGQAHAVDAREAFGEEGGTEIGGVEQHRRTALDGHLASDTAGDHVPRREFGIRMPVRHEPASGRVEQEGTLAAHRFGHQEVAWHCERGGMKLVELDIGKAGTGPEGCGSAIAGGNRWVGGVGVELAGSPTRQDHGIRFEPAHCARNIDGLDSAYLPIDDEEIANEGEFEDAHVRGPDGPHQGALDAGAGRVSARVQDSRARMGGLPAPREQAIFMVELHPKSHQVADAIGPLGAEDLDRLPRVEPCPGRQRVVDVRADAVVREHHRRDTPLRIPGIALPQLGLGHEGHRVGTGGPQGGDESSDSGADHNHSGRDHVSPRSLRPEPSACLAWPRASAQGRSGRGRLPAPAQ